MVKLDRYIGSNVLVAILAVLGVIVGLSVLFSYIDELGSLDNNYSLLDAATWVAWTVPRRIFEMLPMAALIGCLVGLGNLAGGSELTVMRAAGVSLGRIVWAVMRPLLVLLLVGILIGEYLAPWSERQAESGRAMALGGGEALSSKRGLWHREGNEFIHINAVQPNGSLYGVTRYQFDAERNLLSSSFARRAQFQGDSWLLEDIATTEFHENSTEVKRSAQESWDVGLSVQLLSTVVLDPDALSISGLWRYSHYLAEQGLNNGRYWLAFWGKVLQPLVTAALVLMAISFVFGPLRSVTLGQRLFTGVLVGFVFKIVQDLLGPASLVFNFPSILAVVLPALFCALAGGWLLRRAG